MRAGRPSHPVVDVHAHLVPRTLPEFAARWGDARWPSIVVDTGNDRGRIVAGGRVVREIGADYWSPRARVERLDRLGIGVQVLSPLPALMPTWASGGPAAEWCRVVNEAIAAAVAEGGGRFRGLGILPMDDPSAAVAELEHVRAIGLVGVEIATAVDAERTFADTVVDPVLAALAEVRLPVLLHPVRRGLLGDLPGPLDAGIGLPVDSSLAVLPRLLNGRETAMPCVCVAHGGGTIPWSMPRLRSLGVAPRGPLPSWFHVDTAGADHDQVAHLVTTIGAERVLFGTDCPAIGDDAVTAQLDGTAELRTAATVLAGNAGSLFPSTGTSPGPFDDLVVPCQ